ncbi:hypothetical protein TrRE_jg6624 [Triparma retinervis]|uniref:Cilia- and flagella-associated protein 36 n=1 Tax=Triparma retinervis TaxID=2557542 RepID=A0A9W6ZHJ3_9STRA|nr:hypothetical protein TrRE_jg6624 [Triparma retinervis]
MSTDWIFESVAQILKSPAWEAEVFGFIDENCLVFSNDDENKFCYSDLHAEFKEVVERHLTSKLAEFGIGEEVFYEACASNRFKSDINKSVYDQMVAMDDFLTFKKLMVRRNMELELEAVRALQSANVKLKPATTREEEEAQFQAALKASEELTPTERMAAEKANLERGGAEEKGSGGGMASAAAGAVMEKQLKDAIEANMTELEIFHKQEEFERLQLEQAIAASLALHEEELHEAKLEAKRMDASEQDDEGGIGGHDAMMMAEDKKPPAREDDSDDDESEDEEDLGEAGDSVLYGGTPAKATSPSFDHHQMGRGERNEGGERRGGTEEEEVIDAAEAKVMEDNVIDAKAVQTPVKTKTAEAADDKVIQEAEPVLEAEVVGALDREDGLKVIKKKKKKKKEKKEKKKKKERKDDDDAEGRLPSIGGGVLGGLKPLAPIKKISELQDEMNARKQQAEEAFRKNHELLEEQRKKQEELQKQAKMTEEDMQKRAEHLKRQRDMIIAKKKAEREKAARAAREDEAEKAEEFRRKIEHFSTGQPKEEQQRMDEGKGGDEEDDEEQRAADERRANMRIALAANMKKNLLKNEYERLNKMQNEQFAELDEKLRRVEDLRKENRLREEELKDAIKHNQELRALNISKAGV